ncbi:MAG: hypothetical protein KDN05_13065, partial [Verrucomicrobiae bacterium]|nr:hypothetical protein [Verrucomicrobiae bacterium]
MKTPAKLITAVALCWSCATGSVLADNTDNFNDNSKDSAKWGDDVVIANGRLNETSQRLQYTCPTTGLENSSERPWELTRFPYNADWEIQFETYNGASPSIAGQVCSMGVTILSPHSGGDYLYHELYNVSHGVSGGGIGVNTDLSTDDKSVAGEDSGAVLSARVALLVRWNSKTKTLECLYDANPDNGLQWIKLGSFGLSGKGGTSGNTDWEMDASDQFFVSVYGYSALLKVNAGQMYLDDFRESGGVKPDQVKRPKPKGRFPLSFPKD